MSWHSGLALALALLPWPAPAHAANPAACNSDLLLYCAKEPERIKSECLTHNWDHLSRNCRLAMSDPKLNKCGSVIRAHCLDLGPQSGLGNCIANNLAEASPECQKHYQHRPCFAAHQRFCKNTSSGPQRMACLLKHLDSLPSACLVELEKSQDWPKPCDSDAERLCAGIGSPQKQRACLAAHLDELEPVCRAITKRKFACDQDAAKFCKGLSGASRNACLHKNKARVSPRCRQELLKPRLTSAQSQEADSGEK